MNIEQLLPVGRRSSDRWLFPGQDGYEAARRIWNGLIDRRPAAIARCRDRADVLEALSVARRANARVSVRGGGHNVAGTAVVDGGVVIDLRELREVTVDPVARRVHAGGGCFWAEVDAALQAHGLATPGGVFSQTGIAGLTLSGGYGWLSSRFGLACDNLVGAEVVTADGRVVHVPDDDPELLWGLRGGGGNFGVVTEFEYEAHPLDHDVLQVIVMYPQERGREVVRAVRDQLRAHPDELSAIVAYVTTPDDEELPPPARKRDVIAIVGCWSGDLTAGEERVAPLRALGEPVLDLTGPVPYVQMQRFFDREYPDGRFYYWKSTHVGEMTDDFIEAAHACGANRSSKLSSLDLWFLGGKLLCTGPEHGPVRRSRYLVGVEANWDDGENSAHHIEWARAAWRDLSRFGDGGIYLNFAGFGEEREAMLRGAFGDSYERLQRLKRRYDPENVFRSNINITP